ncbi:hypothetical protein ANN_19561 [Periplaneta americana]|uniref:Uncharacterized protein n=1 Tax=Periplaneta americana TaxID=6978 RepID=A0ABQ8SAF5_PERAM|nr:hypothetical protein ANN_19561 [Periplaneta americana]
MGKEHGHYDEMKRNELKHLKCGCGEERPRSFSTASNHLVLGLPLLLLLLLLLLMPSTIRLFSVDGIGDSEMVVGDMRRRIRHRLTDIRLKVRENLGKTQPALRFYPYRLQSLQTLKPGDKVLRRNFCISMQTLIEDNDEFINSVVFSDETTFYLSGIKFLKISSWFENFNTPQAKKWSFGVDEIGDSEISGEMRPRIRDELPGIPPYGWGKPRKKPNQDGAGLLKTIQILNVASIGSEAKPETHVVG